MRCPDWAGGALAAALGAAVVLAVFGPHILPPGHTGWMLSGQIGPDPVQYWLGYTYFRRSPWMWPPGLNPDWGLEISSSIFYSDSIPLLAFIFKALRSVVEVPQYWGLWLVGCGALQGLVGWYLLGLATPHPWPRLALALLLVLQPILLNRLGGHFALGGQFLLLIGLWLYLRRWTDPPPEPWRRLAAWCALLLAASLVHSYLLPMVAGLWGADWLARFIQRAGRGRLALAIELAAVPGAGLFGLWCAGFFVLRGGFGGTWGGYGQMQLDLLAPINPSIWGWLLPRLPEPDHLEVGHSYLGLGAILLVAVGISLARRELKELLRRHWPLLLALAAMLLVAITHRVSIAGYVLELFRLPEPIQRLADALRASERFLWPTTYAAIVGAAIFLVRRWGARRAGWVLSLLVLVQLVDLQPGFARLRWFFTPPPSPVVPLRLHDPFWAEAARHYDRIRLVPTGMQANWWEEVAVMAATYGRPTDAVYLARLDPARVAQRNAQTAAELGSGAYEPGSLYVLGDEGALALARASHDPARDLLAEFNLVWVLAPGWHQRDRSAR
ncbi:MAG: DUF6311 domain-containing protein [Rhodovarius sp.]|nr:DUF6311 domain-containing protein [Rhodovarius sp.]